MGTYRSLVLLLLLGGVNNYPNQRRPDAAEDLLDGEVGLAALPLPTEPIPTTPRKQLYFFDGDRIEDLCDRRNSCRPTKEPAKEPFVETRSISAIAVQSASMVIIIALSIVGNALVLSTLCKKKSLQTKTCIFIACLAIADLLNATLCMPFMLINSITGYWVFTDALCTFSGVMGIVMGTTSLTTLAAIAYERYSAIVHPLQYHDRITNSRIAALISFAWIQGWLLAMCPVFGWSHYNYLSNEYICTVEWYADASYTFTVIALAFGVPFFVMIYCYGHIFRVARRHSRKVAAHDFSANSKRLPAIAAPSNAKPGLTKSLSFHQGTDRLKTKTAMSLSAHKLKKEAKAATMLLIVMGAFMACWVPLGCTMICMAIGDKCTLVLPDAFYTATTWLAMCASFCNPVVYGLMNRQYREAFVATCCSVCLCKSSKSSSSSSNSDEGSTEEIKGSSEDAQQPTVPNFDFEHVEDMRRSRRCSSRCQVFVILRADNADSFKAFEI